MRPHQGLLVNMFSWCQAVQGTGEAKREARTGVRKQRPGQLRGELTTRFSAAVLSNWERWEVNTRLLPQGLNLGQGQPKDKERQG